MEPIEIGLAVSGFMLVMVFWGCGLLLQPVWPGWSA